MLLLVVVVAGPGDEWGSSLCAYAGAPALPCAPLTPRRLPWEVWVLGCPPRPSVRGLALLSCWIACLLPQYLLCAPGPLACCINLCAPRLPLSPCRALRQELGEKYIPTMVRVLGGAAAQRGWAKRGGVWGSP